MDAVLSALRASAVLLFVVVQAASAQVQKPDRVYRVGYLSLAAKPLPPDRDPLVQALRELRYVEGRNIRLERRFAAGDENRLRAMAEDLARLRVDAIVASATPAAQAAQKASPATPIVFWAVVDPVGAGLVSSLASPGGNATGLSLLSAELAGKRLELLQELLPNLSRVGVLLNGGNASNPLQLKELSLAARQRGIEVHAGDVRTADGIATAIEQAVKDRVQAVVALDDPLLFSERHRIAELAARRGLASVYGLRDFAEAGGLVSYGPSPAAQLRRVAIYLDKIFKGTKPAELPVEQPTTFELVINVKTAQQLGITLPPALLLRADTVLQ